VVSLIKLERIKLGWSQIDLWMQTGVPQWRISLIERGLPPKPDERRKLAEALGIPENSFGLPATVQSLEKHQ
jgi:transcriptional regulator with XRE-family HTH domain